jgi:hypothetical protein
MKWKNVVALVLIVLGTLALVYRGFNTPGQARQASLGPVKITVQQSRRVSVPVAAGVGAIALGALLLLLRRR